MNDPNTHSEFVFDPEGGLRIFVDGIPDECEHDWSGDAVHFTASGGTIYWYTYRQWASFTATMRDRLIHEHQQEIGDPITGGAVTCRKCKKIYSPSMFEI